MVGEERRDEGADLGCSAAHQAFLSVLLGASLRMTFTEAVGSVGCTSGVDFASMISVGWFFEDELCLEKLCSVWVSADEADVISKAFLPPHALFTTSVYAKFVLDPVDIIFEFCNFGISFLPLLINARKRETTRERGVASSTGKTTWTYLYAL